MEKSDLRITSKLMLRLLPAQVMLSAAGAVNGIISGYFASNYVGLEAMSAVGLYAPLNMLMVALGAMLAGGCTIICGKHMGRNEYGDARGIFSADMAVSAVLGTFFAAAFLLMGKSGLASLFTRDASLQEHFSRYISWMALGTVPYIFGGQLAPFLAMENKGKNTFYASLLCIAANVGFGFLFVKYLKLEEAGLALASSLGTWTFCLAQAAYFFRGKGVFRLSLKKLRLGIILPAVAVGFPGAATYLYQTLRGFILNGLLDAHTGSAGLSAFGAANNFMHLFWAVPAGMVTVARLVMSVSIGEEDRQSLKNAMKVVFRIYIPLIAAVAAGIILISGPAAGLFFKDSSSEVYSMTAMGLRIIPLCMPFSVLMLHFSCYWQASGRQLWVNILALLDGVLCVAGFSALFIGSMGIKAVYLSNIFNGIVTTLFILLCAGISCGRFPSKLDELMVIPESFGAPEEDRIDVSVRSREEVVSVSDRIYSFCLSKGIDKKRSYFAALALEEMAGNIVEHGFLKDRKSHSADVRAVYRDGDLILRIKDDCVPFDPKQRYDISSGGDPGENIGIRMIYGIMKDISYQNLLGLNVLTIKI